MSVSEKLDSFFKPSSIAIIGASQNLDSISGRPMKYLRMHGYKGEVYPINPKYQEIGGYKCYGSLKDTPVVPELVMIIIRAELVITFLKECVTRGCKNIIIVSSGFAENSPEGKLMQAEIQELARENGLLICGPNSQGMANLKEGVTATFSAAMEMENLSVGPLGFASQSGAFGYSTFCLGQDEKIGFTYIVATGNEAGVGLLDFMEFMLRDPDVRMVAGYAEGIRDGNQFKQVAELSLQQSKPVMLMKVGRSEVGKRAAMSHTAALAGNDRIFDGICRQYGVLRADNIYDIFDASKLFFQFKKLPDGKRVAIVSTSGGAGVMMVDKCVELGLEVPEFPDTTRENLARVVPSLGTTQNPVDVSAQIISMPDAFKKAMRIILAQDCVDVLAILVTMAVGLRAEELAMDIAEVAATAEKPILVSWSVSRALAGEAFDVLDRAGIPTYKTPVQAANALKTVVTYSMFRKNRLERSQSTLHPSFQANAQRKASALKFIRENKDSLTEYECKQLLSLYGISVTREGVAESAREASEKAAEIGFPVALKISSPKIMHKSDVGGIRIGIAGAAEAEASYLEVVENVRRHYPGDDLNGVLVQEMISGGYEVILGAVNDPQFGPVVMFGLGGIYVEIYNDVSYRAAPISRQDALEMIGEVKGSAILRGARGKKKADIAALADTIAAFSEMIVELQDVFKEIDINPLLVLPEGEGVKVVDALVIARDL